MGHPILTNGDYVCSCVKVHTETELQFGVLSGVGPEIGVLDGVHIPNGKGRFLVHWFEWHF